MLAEHSLARGWLLTLRWTGIVGALLAWMVLAASILLRMGSRFEADGVLVSLLPPALEQGTRWVHRITASSCGLLALLCLVAGLKMRHTHHGIRKPIIVIVAVTLLLAVIGPLTPGYRYAWVTVCNVCGGTVLVAGFWWLQRVVACGTTTPMNIWVQWTWVVWLTHIVLGAAASAQIMRGQYWISFVHSGTAMLAALMLAACLRDAWHSRQSKGLVRAMAAGLILQMTLGTAALWLEVVPIALGTMHALLSVFLTIGIVALSITGGATAPEQAQP